MSHSVVYKRTAVLEGHTDAINALVFFHEGRFLASGGDDQTAFIWDVGSTQVQQKLSCCWGQVTALSILAENAELGFPSLLLFVGTGRGAIVVYPFSSRTQTFSEQRSAPFTDVFRLNDAVEAQAIDEVNGRFAVSSNSGIVKVYNIHRGGDISSMDLLWTLPYNEPPINLLYHGDTRERLLVHGLRSATTTLYNSSNGKPISQVTLAGGIGPASVSPDRRRTVVQNLSQSRFDIYDSPESSVIARSIVPTPGIGNMMHKTAFAEEAGCHLVCGGDQGNLFVFDMNTGVKVQDLTHSNDSSVIYAVATVTSDDQHFIASGETEGAARIMIWTKPTRAKIAADLRESNARAEADRRRMEVDIRRQAEEELAALRQVVAQRNTLWTWSILPWLLIFVAAMVWMAGENRLPFNH